MNYAQIKLFDVANGNGVRTSVFVSGCRHHCAGCFNSCAWPFDYGQAFTDETIQKILEESNHPYIAGLTVLGGEPLEPENQEGVLKLLKAWRNQFQQSKSVWLYTGFVLEDLYSTDCRAHTELITDIINNIDVLVDGPFVEAEKDVTLNFFGSRNQRIIQIN